MAAVDVATPSSAPFPYPLLAAAQPGSRNEPGSRPERQPLTGKGEKVSVRGSAQAAPRRSRRPAQRDGGGRRRGALQRSIGNPSARVRAADAASGGLAAAQRLCRVVQRGQPRPQPIKIKMMERHPLGSQAFMPLQNKSYYVVVALEAAEVNPKDLHVFLANGNQGVNYNRNIWHHPLLVSQENNEFLVIDRGGVEDNCEEHWFTEKQGFAELNIK